MDNPAFSVINELNIKLPDKSMENFVQRLTLIDELEIKTDNELSLMEVISYKIIQHNFKNFYQQDILQKIVNSLILTVKGLMQSNTQLMMSLAPVAQSQRSNVSNFDKTYNRSTRKITQADDIAEMQLNTSDFGS